MDHEMTDDINKYLHRLSKLLFTILAMNLLLDQVSLFRKNLVAYMNITRYKISRWEKEPLDM